MQSKNKMKKSLFKAFKMPLFMLLALVASILISASGSVSVVNAEVLRPVLQNNLQGNLQGQLQGNLQGQVPPPTQIQGSLATAIPVCGSADLSRCVPLRSTPRPRGSVTYTNCSFLAPFIPATSTSVARYEYSYLCSTPTNPVMVPVAILESFSVGAEDDLVACDGSIYTLKLHPADSGIIPLKYCEQTSLAPILECPSGTFEILLSPSFTRTSNRCLLHKSTLFETCPAGYIEFAGQDSPGSASRVNLNEFVFGTPPPNPLPTLCLGVIRRGTKCPAPSVEGNVVFSFADGTCAERAVPADDDTACGGGFTGTFPNCMKGVDPVADACPGSTITQQQKTDLSLPSSFSVGDLLPGVSTAYPTLAIHLQTSHSLLMSIDRDGDGFWPIIAEADATPNTAAGVRFSCARLIDSFEEGGTCAPGTRAIVGSVDDACAREVSQGLICPVGEFRIVVAENLDIAFPVAGRLRGTASSPGTADIAGSASCFSIPLARQTCPMSAPRLIGGNCLPATTTADFTCSGIFNRATGECVLSITITPQDACPDATFGVLLTSELCGRFIEGWEASATCDEDQLAIRIAGSAGDSFNCYFPARHLCQGIQNSLGYFLIRPSVTYEASASVPELTISKVTTVHCVYGLNLECEDGFELDIGDATELDIRTPMCRNEVTASELSPATVVPCPTGQIAINVLTSGLRTMITQGVYDAVRLAYLAGNTRALAGLSFCTERAQLESTPACNDVDVSDEDRRYFVDSNSNGFYDVCFKLEAPLACQAADGGDALTARCENTSARFNFISSGAGICTTGLSLFKARSFYNEFDSDACFNQIDPSIPVRCIGSRGFVYVFGNQVEGSLSLPLPTTEQFTGGGSVERGGVCARLISAATNCQRMDGQSIDYYTPTSLNIPFVTGCYETRASQTVCPAGYENVLSGGVRTNQCQFIPIDAADTFSSSQIAACTDTTGAAVPGYTAAPQPGSFAAFVNRYFVSQPLEIAFKFPEDIVCSPNNELRIVSVTASLTEVKPFIEDFSGAVALPTGDWRRSPELYDIDLGNWECINGVTLECTDSSGVSENARYRSLYESLYGNNGAWFERLEESKVCTSITDPDCEIKTGDLFGNSVITVTPERATWYKISVIFTWELFLLSGTPGTAGTAVTTVVDVFDEIIPVGEVQSSIRLRS